METRIVVKITLSQNKACARCSKNTARSRNFEIARVIAGVVGLFVSNAIANKYGE